MAQTRQKTTFKPEEGENCPHGPSGSREHKDRLFSFLFGREDHREWTLSLLNAISGSSFQDSGAIEMNTMENVLYLGMHNDVSFLICDLMHMWEQQSTFNPNMPLRMLQLAGNLYAKYLKQKGLNKYGTKQILLPVPKLIVCYNGTTSKEDEIMLNLSDAFPAGADADIKVRVRMININLGHSEALLSSCSPLGEYAWLIAEIRKNHKAMSLENSISKAIHDMPDSYVIKPLLAAHKTEVFGMLLTEYDVDEAIEMFKAEAWDDGLAKGHAQGLTEGRAEGKAEGRLIGLAEGLAEGFARGELSKLIQQICCKLRKGKPARQIAEELETDFSEIEPICLAAEKFSPDYPDEQILSALLHETA